MGEMDAKNRADALKAMAGMGKDGSLTKLCKSCYDDKVKNKLPTKKGFLCCATTTAVGGVAGGAAVQAMAETTETTEGICQSCGIFGCLIEVGECLADCCNEMGPCVCECLKGCGECLGECGKCLACFGECLNGC